MKIFGIDSSGLVASVALMVDGKLICDISVNNLKTHSQTLLPMVSEVLKNSDVDKKELDAIALSNGPGSFTGLRIGSATAKGMAMALDIPIVEVSSLMGLAMNVYHFDGCVCPIMDARRKQVYFGLYGFEDGLPKAMTEDGVGDIEKVLEDIIIPQIQDKKIMFLGDGVPVYKEIVTQKLGERALFAAPTQSYQNASSIAYIGEKMFEKGEFVAHEKSKPSYIRKSQAQRELENHELKEWRL